MALLLGTVTTRCMCGWVCAGSTKARKPANVPCSARRWGLLLAAASEQASKRAVECVDSSRAFRDEWVRHVERVRRVGVR